MSAAGARQTGVKTIMSATSLPRLSKWASLLLVAITLALSGLAMAPATAQEIPPEQLDLGRKYVQLVGYEGIYQLTLAKQAAETFKTLSPQNPKLEKEINEAIKAVLDGYRDKGGDLLDQYARLFATTFTAAELQEMVNFYSSPTGQKLAHSSADLNEGMRAILGVYTNTLGPEFFAKVRAELKAKGYDL